MLRLQQDDKPIFFHDGTLKVARIIFKHKAHRQLNMNNTPLEETEQRTVVEYLRLKRIPFFSVPNSQELSAGKRHVAARVMNKLKALGLSPGVPDLIIFLPGTLLCIEMKRRKGGVVSKAQKHWSAVINSFKYSTSRVCRGADEAIDVIGEHEDR